MFQKLLSHPVVSLAIVAMVALGVFICVFPHYFPSFSWGVNYAVQLMLLYLAGGMVFLFLKQPRLTLACFAGCAALCFFLKYSVKNDSIERWRQTVIQKRMPEPAIESGPTLKLAHLNVTNIRAQAEVLEAIERANADILSVHEVTPDWEQWLLDSVAPHYPHYHAMVDIGIFGVAVFSKHRLEQVDTFYHEGIPNLRIMANLDGQPVCLVSIHTEPALNTYSLRRLQEHLALAADSLKKVELPLIVFGDFNAVNWSDEIKVFLKNADLLQSRMGFMAGGFPFGVPLDHIFYSRHFMCNDFYVMRTPSSSHLGIIGTFQLNRQTQHVRKTAQ